MQADFSRQERITGQHIDIVIGGDDVRRMFDNDLSQLPIDLQVTVPYAGVQAGSEYHDFTWLMRVICWSGVVILQKTRRILYWLLH